MKKDLRCWKGLWPSKEYIKYICVLNFLCCSGAGVIKEEKNLNIHLGKLWLKNKTKRDTHCCMSTPTGADGSHWSVSTSWFTTRGPYYFLHYLNFGGVFWSIFWNVCLISKSHLTDKHIVLFSISVTLSYLTVTTSSFCISWQKRSGFLRSYEKWSPSRLWKSLGQFSNSQYPLPSLWQHYSIPLLLSLFDVIIRYLQTQLSNHCYIKLC